jgi:glycosyltransferase involved in cell wall biosynthesis
MSDARWVGHHGIGRFAREVLSRLPAHNSVTRGPKLLSPMDSVWLSWQIARHRPDVYFSPGFNPPLFCASPLVFTIHDLIHLGVPEEGSPLKRSYFKHVVLPSAQRAFRVLTVSEHSKRQILRWSRLPEHRVVVAGNGVDSSFSPVGPSKEFGARYLLYVGNRKPHKNLDRLFQAFKGVDDPDLRLVLSGAEDARIGHRLAKAGIESRVVFAGNVQEKEMPALYRGATALLLPSLEEGFGLPLVEAMASGTPVVAARAASIPEVVANAAILFDPLDTGDMRNAMERVLGSSQIRAQLRALGLNRAKHFSWDRVARAVTEVLESARESPSRKWVRQAQFS